MLKWKVFIFIFSTVLGMLDFHLQTVLRQRAGRKYQFTFPNIPCAINCSNPMGFVCAWGIWQQTVRSTQRSDFSPAGNKWRDRKAWDRLNPWELWRGESTCKATVVWKVINTIKNAVSEERNKCTTLCIGYIRDPQIWTIPARGLAVTLIKHTWGMLIRDQNH